MKKVLSILVLLSLHLLIIAQEVEPKKKQYKRISFDYGIGDVMKTTEFVAGVNQKGIPVSNYQSYSVRMLWQNPGYTHWQQVFNSPYYGFGVTVNNFFNSDELGFPVSAYGILGLPIKRWRKLHMYGEFQYGIAAGWKHYDENKNVFNLAIGSPVTVHVTGGINTIYHLTNKIDVGISGNFVHFSNGGMVRPNRGINNLTASAKVNYNFGGRANTDNVKIESPRDKARSLLLMLTYGNHQLVEHELDSHYYDIRGISAIYLEQFSQAFRLGVGTDINYWCGLNAKEDGSPAKGDMSNLTLAFVLQPEIIIDRLTLVGGVGIYAHHRNYGDFKQSYQRLGVRYDFYKNFAAGVNVRAINYMLAEFMEFNISYRFDWLK